MRLLGDSGSGSSPGKLASGPEEHPVEGAGQGTPEEWIDGPLLAALDGIVFRATAGFALSATIAAAPFLLRLPDLLRDAAHLALPGAWASYAAVAWMRSRSRPDPALDGWEVARRHQPGAARAASMARAGLPIGWSIAGIALLVHHLGTTAGVAEAIGIYLPVFAVCWWIACWSWRRGCRLAVGTAASARTLRLRSHLAALGSRAESHPHARVADLEPTRHPGRVRSD